jgi:hypothetical protein
MILTLAASPVALNGNKTCEQLQRAELCERCHVAHEATNKGRIAALLFTSFIYQ